MIENKISRTTEKTRAFARERKTMPIRLEVWGPRALFTRPDLKAERVTYDVITPSAARGILDSIYWHPGMHYVIDQIQVLSPIKTDCIKRNEIGAVVNSTKLRKVMEGRTTDPGYIYTGKEIQQRSSVILKDVHYIIDAHFVMTGKAHPDDSPEKFISIIGRRIKNGQCYMEPYFGCREFHVDFAPFSGEAPCPEELRGETELGVMLWDMDYSDPEDIRPLFYRPIMKDGVIKVPARDSGEVFGYAY